MKDSDEKAAREIHPGMPDEEKAAREIYRYLEEQDGFSPTCYLPERQVPAFIAIIKKYLLTALQSQTRVYRVFAKGTLNLDALHGLDISEHPVLEWATTFGYYISRQAARERAEEVARERWDKHNVNRNWISATCLRSGMDDICIAEHILDEPLNEESGQD